jgi:hypothetical protein
MGKTFLIMSRENHKYYMQGVIFFQHRELLLCYGDESVAAHPFPEWR